MFDKLQMKRIDQKNVKNDRRIGVLKALNGLYFHHKKSH
ncbi:MAG: hypothetical protein ACI83W_001356 [Marinoscillum sp.]|jgi:hypothetical protein